jgi:putative PEP-CTERM system histidine kinase
MNLERTFRTAVGTMRWRIKYMTLGCGVLLGAQIYTSSQAILFSGIGSSTITFKASARLLGYSLVAFSLFRSRLAGIDLYPSHQFLFRSLTAVVAGLYLLAVGVLAKLAVLLGVDTNFPLKSFLVLVGFVGLAVLMMSDRLRQRAQRALSRHFRRPIHDYRKLWTVFAERTASLVTPQDLCREVCRLVSETFNVLSVTVFLVDEQKQQLIFGASTSLPEEKANEMLQGASNIGSLLDWTMSLEPVDMDTSTEPWLLSLKKLSPDFFNKGGGRICAPLVASGRLLGFITLTDRVSGLAFSVEDFDLLKCVSGQVSSSLLNVNLSSSLIRSKELEAFQTMSTFFVHDLKNTALMLSLMLENLPIHFANPEFREDSLRGISRTVERINDLISRLSTLREGLQIAPVDVDLNQLVSSSLENLRNLSSTRIEQTLAPLPSIRADPEQLQKVFTNLVLNARDAVAQGGQIQVETSQVNGWAVLQVTDNGCGISPEFLQRSLFRPFQTTKKKGIGIGMYQSKMIVEAHAGRIEVQSDLGKGTTFRVLLPLKV